MSKIRIEFMYDMFPFKACQALLGCPLLFDYYVSCVGHDSYKCQGQTLAFVSLAPPHKYKPWEGYGKSLHISESVKHRMRAPLLRVSL